MPIEISSVPTTEQRARFDRDGVLALDSTGCAESVLETAIADLEGLYEGKGRSEGGVTFYERRIQDAWRISPSTSHSPCRPRSTRSSGRFTAASRSRSRRSTSGGAPSRRSTPTRSTSTRTPGLHVRRMGRSQPCNHPAGAAEAIAALDAAALEGATHLVVPSVSIWWLDHYRGLAEHLGGRGREVHRDEHCAVWSL